MQPVSEIVSKTRIDVAGNSKNIREPLDSRNQGLLMFLFALTDWV